MNKVEMKNWPEETSKRLKRIFCEFALFVLNGNTESFVCVCAWARALVSAFSPSSTDVPFRFLIKSQEIGFFSGIFQIEAIRSKSS